jgi:hypothetical protein
MESETMRGSRALSTRLDDGVIHVLPEGHAPLSVTHEVSERWLMAFAAGVGDTRPAYFDVERPGGIVAHPIFAACLEWPLVAQGAPGIALTGPTLNRGLHVEQTTTLHAPVRPGRVLTTTAELCIAEQRKHAVHIATKFTTTDELDRAVAVTLTHMLFAVVMISGV